MTSIPASRRALAITLAPRSWPSRPGFATSTRIFASVIEHHLNTEDTKDHRARLCARRAQTVLISKLRHIYQQATLRYGSHARAIFSMSFGFGSLRFL